MIKLNPDVKAICITEYYLCCQLGCHVCKHRATLVSFQTDLEVSGISTPVIVTQLSHLSDICYLKKNSPGQRYSKIGHIFNWHL